MTDEVFGEDAANFSRSGRERKRAHEIWQGAWDFPPPPSILDRIKPNHGDLTQDRPPASRPRLLPRVLKFMRERARKPRRNRRHMIGTNRMAIAVEQRNQHLADQQRWAMRRWEAPGKRPPRQLRS